MYCNRCGNPIEQNSQFCTTCGSAINTTVVPQTNPTVVPTNETVVPTVVPQNTKSSVTITSIIVVLVVFIGAGIVGILLLRNSKANVNPQPASSQVALADITSAITEQKTKKTNTWASTTTAQRVDKIENSLSVNGLTIHVPEGYNPSYTNDVLTLIDSTGTKYFLINVIAAPYEAVDTNKFKNDLIANGYDVHTFEVGTYANRNGIYMTLTYMGFRYKCYVIKANSSRVAFYLFDESSNEDYIYSMIDYSLK